MTWRTSRAAIYVLTAYVMDRFIEGTPPPITFLPNDNVKAS
jgi:hypothetical protein